MAFTAVVTKQPVAKLNDDDYQVTIHLVVLDELEEVVLEKDYSERYYSSASVETIKIKLQNKILADWSKLVDEANIFNASAFDAVVSEIEIAANNYINL